MRVEKDNIFKILKNESSSNHQKTRQTALALLSMFWSTASFANVVGAPFQNFSPTHSPTDFVTVYSSQTLGKGQFGLGLFLNRATNTLPYVEGTQRDVKQTRSHTNDSLIGADLTLGYGILDNWDIGIVMPQILSQSINSNRGVHGHFEKNGLTDLRLASKVKLLGDETGGLAFIGSLNFNQTQNNPFKGPNSSPNYNFEVAGDMNLTSHWSVAANLGYRVINSSTPKNTVPISPSENQIIASAAAGYMVPSWKSQIIAEYFSSISTSSKDEVPSRSDTTSEILAGIKRFHTEDLVLHAGGGTELNHGVSTPDWRLYAGVQYVISPTKQAATAPQPVPVTQRAPDEIIVVNDINFQFDSATMIKKGSRDSIENFVKLARTGAPVQSIIIEGHTCNMGGTEYNQKLSFKRANTIRELLIREYGFKSEQIKAVGIGPARPVASNSSAEGRKKNRRVEFKIYREEIIANN